MLIAPTPILAAVVTGLLAQAPTVRKAYDVVSIKPNKSNDDRFMLRFGPNLSGTGVTLKMLIMETYRVRAFQISGAPDWIGLERWDIQAKAEGVQGPIPGDQVRTMVRALMEDRFQLKVHRETKEMPVYTLVVGKNGPKLTPHTGEPPQPGQGNRSGPGWLTIKKGGTTALANQLSLQLGRTVIDKTDLKGEYDYTLEWAQEPGQGGPEAYGLPPDPPRPQLVDSDRPSIFTAVQEQLGLRLDSQKGPVEIIVIDHVEKPSVN